jgi:hypothetical protein
MPIEIRELQITVTEGAATTSSSEVSAGPAAGNTDQIVAICVEQVIDILRQKNER